jgi:hypothetical protein
MVCGSAHAAEGVRLAREHLDALREARPYQLDDASVAGVVRTWTVARDDLDQLFIEQVAAGGNRPSVRSLLEEDTGRLYSSSLRPVDDDRSVTHCE